MVATTGDPAEQFESGVLMMYDGWRQGACGLGRSCCVGDAVSRYLAGAVPPAARAACPRHTTNG